MPHYNLVGYSEKFDAIVKEYELVGITIDNDGAIELVDNTYRVVATRDKVNVYKVYNKGTKIIKEI